MKNINRTKERIWYGVFGVLGIVILAQIIITGMYAGKGMEWTKLKTRASDLARENQQLQQDLAQKTSLQEVSSRAQTLGFVKSSSVVYADFATSVAMAR
ncbi:MAG: hypothetical protein A3D24_02085 [Candidatus Blackburnbacteria bacterium RIFCSPHIGHO2_02_FULL_39_13]|uniref:Cell division protein FtsL n=1 Tax=Candidatus Blackburnbacteria bacterium RIFCSPLOWO2_01_FULL_40_20 TaxID=1797519 RepID=A0A1G1VDU9_9BACT|nr:MAG: hypothetical protein UT38_C0001G0021 [Microgenomates group bacterium GW2011_GWA2_39_19]OGY06922.1 MAG: hypothetical protein A2694_04035 [Candidatus Blackburnbacteria bacterium RIFCSPHIGHO2_01_FULL_40_17]OGY09188.1 MAG: hypothetical protein A3D24_02085 [Candidatus Blackburnbacteria bacterium RIFCSPHIGHO2_02_FULL_39_13]OGY13575.1 MAG: hypothetical protein A3A77_04270 [Candidatus Blackburnbacteria bacterium RIFCSPLOWO2_01_FULL_40_20]HBL52227.1 hypothetical protein [Candidatus Blackburnbact